MLRLFWISLEGSEEFFISVDIVSCEQECWRDPQCVSSPPSRNLQKRLELCSIIMQLLSRLRLFTAVITSPVKAEELRNNIQPGPLPRIDIHLLRSQLLLPSTTIQHDGESEAAAASPSADSYAMVLIDAHSHPVSSYALCHLNSY
jgi:hypothetical protein